MINASISVCKICIFLPYYIQVKHLPVQLSIYVNSGIIYKLCHKIIFP